MDYEKKYNEALELARNYHNGLAPCRAKDELETIFPQLRESEDERVIRTLFYLVKDHDWINGATKGEALAWLEKQKENPKSADSIPEDCASNAKCEDRWHKTANSLPNTGRDVLAKDALGNYLLASFDGAQWFVSVYDGQDHPVLHTPPILEWCEIPSEKQKESLHISETCKENADSFTSEQKVPDCCLKCNEYEIGYKAGYEHGCTAGYNKAMKEVDEQKEQKPVDYEAELKKCKDNPLYFYDKYVSIKQKPAEWSKEDEMYLSQAIETLEHENYSILADKLKSLRPVKQEWSEEDKKIVQSLILEINKYVFFAGIEANKIVSFLRCLRPSWKPSEEQMDSLRDTIVQTKGYSYSMYLPELYEQLKKL